MRKEKLVKILAIVFLMVFSFTVLTHVIPESKFVQDTVKHLEDSQNTIMKFSGTTIATSLSLSALPNDFASPLASTVSDLNTYFIFIFAVLFVEKLLVIEGIKIALVWMIPAACVLGILAIVFEKEMFKNFAKKLLILGISVIMVVPMSTHFTETVCADYLTYVDETIEEADAGAGKINEIMAEGNEQATFFDKLSDAFKTAISDVNDLLAYFKNVVKKCVNSVAVMIVTTFVLPMLVMLLFRWLLTELFALHLPAPKVSIKLPKELKNKFRKETDLIEVVNDDER
jgi:predicted PurR-regulated permease PerM